jgi:hypothetical protein
LRGLATHSYAIALTHSEAGLTNLILMAVSGPVAIGVATAREDLLSGFIMYEVARW